MHRIIVEDQPLELGATVLVSGPEAEHALRVKRLEPGQHVGLLDLAGTFAVAVIDRAGKSGKRFELAARIEECRVVPDPTPLLEVWSATPKGAHVDQLIDQLSQLGAYSWRPLRTERGVVDPRPTKLARLERLAREAAKQSARTRALAILPEIDFHEALDGPHVFVCDPTGLPAPEGPPPDRCRLLLGPEGGWSERELDVARSRGATFVRLGPNLMRIETAAAAAAAVFMRYTEFAHES